MIANVRFDLGTDNLIINNIVTIVSLDDFIKGNHRLLFDQSVITLQEAKELVQEFAINFLEAAQRFNKGHE